MKKQITVKDLQMLQGQTTKKVMFKVGHWLTKARESEDADQAEYCFNIAKFWLTVGNLIQTPLLAEASEEENYGMG